MRKGQALIVVLMILAVTTAVGLSVVSRTTTEVAISNTQEESTQALSAAESGIEKVLSGDLSQTSVTTTESSHQYLGTTPLPPATNINLPGNIKSGEGATLHLVSNFQNTTTYAGGFTGNFNVCWGDPTLIATEVPAVQLDLYSYRSGSYRVSSIGYDLNSRGGFSSNQIVSGNTTSSCPTDKRYAYARPITFSQFPGFLAGDNPLIVRMKLFYNQNTSHYVGVLATSGGNFTSQGNTYSVRGISGSTSRKIEVDQGNPEPLPIFDNALFSGVGITLQ
jgi:Tfp pilus assembly protein PilX